MMSLSEHQSSQEWLKEHGLRSNGLSLSQILCFLGFQQCSGEVKSLGHSVTSQYGTDIFLQHPDQTGHVYNLVDASEDRLQQFEVRLSAIIDSLKYRLQWLNSGSHKQCGVVCDKRILIMLIENSITHKKKISSVEKAVINLLQEQGSYLTHLNIIRGITTSWKKCLIEVHEKDITEAIEWVATSSTVMETGMEALIDDQIEAIYMLVDGNEMTEDFNDLIGKIKQLSTLVHVVIVDCMSAALLQSCLALTCGGRCHADGSKEGILCLPRSDVLEIWNELEQARDTLAQIQALHMEVTEKRRVYHNRTTESHTKKHTALPDKSSHRKNVVCKAMKAEVSCCRIDIPQTRKENKTLNKTHNTTRNKIVTPIRYHDKQKTRLAAVPPVVSDYKSISKYLTGVVKGSTVLACCIQDGFYYKGNVVSSLSKKRTEVKFLDGEKQIVEVNKLIIVGGAVPRPELRRCDYVLCCVRQKQGMHCSEFGVCDYYIPAQVEIVPSQTNHSIKLFFVRTFDGEHVSCTRSGLEKISELRYQAMCSHIAKCKTRQHESQTEATALHDTHNEQTIIDTTNHNIIISTGNFTLDDKDDVSANETSGTSRISEPPETRDIATSVYIPTPTQNQSVGTGPQTMDQYTITEYSQQAVESPGEDEIDYTHLPVLEVGSQVLCCWPDRGWYYKASVLGSGNSECSWNVRAESGEVSDIPISHIINISSSNIIHEGVLVLAPHPLFPTSFAPGTVSNGHSNTIIFYDSIEANNIPRDEVQVISPDQYKAAVARIQERDKCWVGQVVLGRKDSDGVYYPAIVTEQLERQCYILQWSDGSKQEQSILHMFGSLTSRRPLNVGDHVLALAMPGIGACLPGTITSRVYVKFSDGERQTVSKEQCFWISPAYFISAIEYISTSFAQSYLT